MFQRHVDQDEALHPTFHQHPRHFLDQLRRPAVTGDEMQVAFAHQSVLDGSQHRGSVAFTDLRNHYRYGKATLVAEIAGIKIWAIVKGPRRLQHSILCRPGNGT